MDESGEPAKPQIPTPQPQPTTFESKPHINSWFIWLGVVLAAVAGSFLLTYFVLLPRTASRIPVSTPRTTVVPSPTPPPAGGPTANWQTYVNQDMGFSLKYPIDEFPIVREDKSGVTFANNNGSFKPLDTSFWAISIRLVDNNPNPSSIKSYIDQMISEAPSFATEGLERLPLTIGGESAEKLVGYRHTDISIDDWEIYVEHNQKIYQFDIGPYMNDPTVGKKRQNIANLILSTFKFTDQSSAVDTSTWKLYNDQTFRFSINYLSSWSENTTKEDQYGFTKYTFSSKTNTNIAEDNPSGFLHKSVVVTVYEKSQDPKKDLNTYFQDLYNKSKESIPTGPGEAKIENLTIGSLPAVKLVNHAPIEPAVSLYVDVYKTPYLYEISAWQDGGYQIDSDLQNIFYQMLSTFKFL